MFIEKTIMDSPVGKLNIITQNNNLLRLEYLLDKKIAVTPKPKGFAATVVKQLQHYFKNPLFQFNLPLSFEGTAHQQKVWQALLAIPCGETRSYLQLSQYINSSPRAIGGACRSNPIALIIPCHRVLSAQGMGGFMGKTAGKALAVKRWLLQHEQAL